MVVANKYMYIRMVAKRQKTKRQRTKVRSKLKEPARLYGLDLEVQGDEREDQALHSVTQQHERESVLCHEEEERRGEKEKGRTLRS